MTEIIVSISLYLVAAILLGFTFGWFIAKGMLKEKYNEQLEILSNLQDSNDVEKLKEELNASKASNRELMDAKNRLALEYEKEHASLEKNVDIKESGENQWAVKFKNLEEKYVGLKQQHEKEIEAFLEERVEITQKYKELLNKMKTLENSEDNPSLEKKSSWFGKSS